MWLLYFQNDEIWIVPWEETFLWSVADGNIFWVGWEKVSVWKWSLTAAGHGSGWSRFHLLWVNWLIVNWVTEIPGWEELDFAALDLVPNVTKLCPHHKVNFPLLSLFSAVLLDLDSVVNHLGFCRGVIFPWSAGHCISWSSFTVSFASFASSELFLA